MSQEYGSIVVYTVQETSRLCTAGNLDTDFTVLSTDQKQYIHFCAAKVIPTYHNAPIEHAIGPRLVPGPKLELGIQLIAS